MTRGERLRLFVAIVAVPVAVWLNFRAFGYFVTIQKSGGWTGQAEPIDFSTEPEARTLLESWPAASDSAGAAVIDNVILLLGDGMGFSHVTAARSQLVGINRLLTFERFPVTRWLEAHSHAEVYTDSAAGATALATGVRTVPGALGVDADGRRLRTLFEAARDAGKATGWITDSYFFDASPAAFVAHRAHRGDYLEIVGQMLESGSELIIGEVREDYPADEAGLAGLYERFRAAGYDLATTSAELWGMAWTEADKLAGIFPHDAIASDDVEPNLPAVLDLALGRLSIDPQGFVLVAEVEDPDSGSHNGDFGQVLRGIRKLEEMTRKAVTFSRSNGRTLVLLTSDHETGGLTLITGDAEKPLGIRWATTNHTGEPVPLYAFGPGAEELAAVRDNTDVAPILARLLGVDLARLDRTAVETE